MLLFPPTGPAAARRTPSTLLVLLVILAFIQVSVAQDTIDANDAATTDAATMDDTTATTASETTASNTDSTSSTESTTSSSSTSTSTPVVTVPPTADAPYMQTSSTPEGAVFIAVGAVLGFFGLAVLAWRGLVAWSVNRSVRQAAMMHSSETKGLLRSRRKRSTVRSRGPSGSGMPFSKPGGGGGPGGGYQRHRSGSGSGSHGPPPKTSKVVPSSNSGLFFSPTAGARMYSSSRRPPVFHPSGYHAAPGGDAPQSPPYRPHPQSYNNNTAYSYSHSRGQSGPSPPTSPIIYPTGAYDTHARYPMSRPLSSDNTSNSSLNLNHASPPQGRAPSEYLEDLFDNHGQVPPTGGFGRR